MSDAKVTIQQRGGGIGLCGMVFIVFLILKLSEIGTVATWSWWWVTAPLWMPLTIVLVIMLGALVLAGIAYGAACLIQAIQKRR